MTQSLPYFASCPKGLEGLLLGELDSFGAVAPKETIGGVYFAGGLAMAYRACLWSRLANRVLLPLVVEDCSSVDGLYRVVQSIDWQEHLDLDGTFAVDFSGKMRELRHSHFGALKVKDAIADQFTARCGRRPNVDTERPDIRVNARLNKGKLTIVLDLSGQSLHRRGYRLQGGLAPLKENLAAAILLRADWPGMAARGGALIDPMCGSGTLLIEGALMTANIAPGLDRLYWGFDGWLGHQGNVWRALVEEAESIRADSMSRQWPEIRGYDASPKAIGNAQGNIDRAGLNDRVRVLRKELNQFRQPSHQPLLTGLVLTNPPYGERLGDEAALLHLYRHLGQRLREEFVGWRAGIFTGNPDLGKQMGLRSNKQYQLYNGPIACKLLLFDVQQAAFVNAPPAALRQAEPASAQPVSIDQLNSGAQMFANRIRKNCKQLDKWARKNQLVCYRIYDADMPEYAVAVDRYQDWLHVAEYQAPSKVSPEAASKRLDELMAALPLALDIAPGKIVLKQRKRQNGSEQYGRQAQSNTFMEVVEGQAKVLVNLRDYLDTGLFLDHRPVRLFIAEQAKNKRFLNLFCYTAVATLQAALAGAKRSDSVDLSATYLQWAAKNLALNGLSETVHRLHRADCMEWLKNCVSQYDLILLDPPTFSNSKKMQATLDIQRDQLALIDAAMSLLDKDGLLIFSNNHRQFSLDESIVNKYQVENKTPWSLDKDFQRSKRIHQCWFIRYR